MFESQAESDALMIEALRQAHYSQNDDAIVEFANRALRERALYHKPHYPKSVASLTEFQNLPILKKETLRAARPSDLTAGDMGMGKAIADGSLHQQSTSGSGAQVSVWAKETDGAFVPVMAHLLMDLPLDALLNIHMLTSPLCSGTTCHLHTTLIPTSDIFAEPAGYFRRLAKQLAQLGPGLLLTNAIILHQVIRRCRQEGIELKIQGGVLSSYQRMSELQKRAIQAALHLPIFDQYGATELSGCVATSACKAGTPHVWASQVFVEIVDDEGRPVPEGTMGNVVITNIAAEGTRLLRYEVGDLGTLKSGPCACGLANTKHLYIHGRRSESWRQDGVWITPEVVDQRLSAVPGLDFYQLTYGREQKLRALVVPTQAGQVPREQIKSSLADLAPMGRVVESRQIFVNGAQKYPLLRRWQS